MKVTLWLMFHHQNKLLWKGLVLSFTIPGPAMPHVCHVLLMPGEQGDQNKKNAETIHSVPQTNLSHHRTSVFARNAGL